jgi:hypothetical protein
MKRFIARSFSTLLVSVRVPERCFSVRLTLAHPVTGERKPLASLTYPCDWQVFWLSELYGYPP